MAATLPLRQSCPCHPLLSCGLGDRGWPCPPSPEGSSAWSAQGNEIPLCGEAASAAPEPSRPWGARDRPPAHPRRPRSLPPGDVRGPAVSLRSGRQRLWHLWAWLLPHALVTPSGPPSPTSGAFLSPDSAWPPPTALLRPGHIFTSPTLTSAPGHVAPGTSHPSPVPPAPPPPRPPRPTSSPCDLSWQWHERGLEQRLEQRKPPDPCPPCCEAPGTPRGPSKPRIPHA